MKNLYVIITISIALLSCQKLFSQEKEKVSKISMIHLISNPEKYHNKKVIVSAYLKIEREGNAIYLNEDDYKYSIYKNAIFVYIDSNKIKEFLESPYEDYVSISGVFNKNNKGHLNLFSGSLHSITYIRKLRKKKNSE